MNANELADKLLQNNLVSWGKCTPEDHDTAIWTNEQAATMLRQQQAEIEALKSLNTLMKDAIEKRIELDAIRYQWLRTEFAAGRETYLAEGIPSGEALDKYIDGKAQEK
jgi:hypothetical protein